MTITTHSTARSMRFLALDSARSLLSAPSVLTDSFLLCKGFKSISTGLSMIGVRRNAPCRKRRRGHGSHVILVATRSRDLVCAPPRRGAWLQRERDTCPIQERSQVREDFAPASYLGNICVMTSTMFKNRFGDRLGHRYWVGNIVSMVGWRIKVGEGME